MARLQKLAGSLAGKLRAVFGSLAGDRVGVLTYHRIQPCTPGLPDPAFNVTPDVFREQLTGLQRAGFEFIRLSDVTAAHRTGKRFPPKQVVVTFDDAFESVYVHALPILRELNIPAVAFLSTAYIDSQVPFPFDPWGREFAGYLQPSEYRPLQRLQCSALLESGLFELGAHTHSHADFRNAGDVLTADLSHNVELLRDWFHLDEVTFAFPYGKTHLGFAGGELSAAARRAGVSCALTTDCELVDVGTDPYSWGRLSVSQWDTSADLAGKLAGWYGGFARLQKRLDQRRGAERSAAAMLGPHRIAPAQPLQAFAEVA